MVYKDGVFNMHTQNFIKKIYKALMKNHHLWLVKKKVIIYLLKVTTKYLRRFNIKIYILFQFNQEDRYLIGLILSPNIHYKLLKTPLHEFLQVRFGNN
jgi:hypothetical protein